MNDSGREERRNAGILPIQTAKGTQTMTTEQLRYFITVVHTGSYMEAALELNISQSTVSKQIQILERELGVTLFDRSFRKAKLTPEGEKLLPEARSLMGQIDHFFYSASRLRSDTADDFTVLTLPFVGFLNLYAPLTGFEESHPALHLKVIELEEPQLTKQLAGNEFDMAITYEYEYHSTAAVHRRFIPVTEDEAVLAVHREYPLSVRQSITLNDIADVPLFLMGEHTCIAKLCDLYFHEQNFTPQVIFRGMPETLIAGVKAKRGCAVISKKQAESYSTPEIAMIPFTPSLSITIGAVPNESSPHTRQIQDLLSLLVSNETFMP